MAEYNPDKWVIVKIVSPKETLYKVIGGWGGGYLHGSSWRMNSGITTFGITHGGTFLFGGTSGSIYRCHPEAYGLNMASAGAWKTLEERVEGLEGFEIFIMPEDTVWSKLGWEFISQ